MSACVPEWIIERHLTHNEISAETSPRFTAFYTAKIFSDRAARFWRQHTPTQVCMHAGVRVSYIFSASWVLLQVSARGTQRVELINLLQVPGMCSDNFRRNVVHSTFIPVKTARHTWHLFIIQPGLETVNVAYSWLQHAWSWTKYRYYYASLW